MPKNAKSPRSHTADFSRNDNIFLSRPGENIGVYSSFRNDFIKFDVFIIYDFIIRVKFKYKYIVMYFI